MYPDFWNQRYGSDTFAYGREPNDFLREVADRIPRGPVLCLAEGEGRNAVFLAGLGHEVTAVDFSAQGLRKAERLARENGVALHTVQADLASYEPPHDSFTGVVAIFAHLPPPVRARVHGWVSRVLRPGGVFVLEAYRPAQLTLGTGGPPTDELMMTLAGLRSELTSLTLEIAREADREIQEGTFHRGMSATVQVLAVRSAADADPAPSAPGA